LGNGIWGTASDIAAVVKKFIKLEKWANDNNMPVMISEFGNVRECDNNSQMLHYAIYVEEATSRSISFMAWHGMG